MAYTRSWNDATPAGTRAANQIDDAIREFKVDVHERMDDIVDDWTADPVVPQGAVSGAKDGKYLLFGPGIMVAQDDENDVVHQEQYFENDPSASNKTARGHILLPIGITIVEVAAMVDRNFNSGVRVVFYSSEFTNGTPAAVTVIDTLDKTTSGVGIVTSAAPLSVVTDENTLYMIKLNATAHLGVAGVKFYGFRVKYNTPDSRFTI